MNIQDGYWEALIVIIKWPLFLIEDECANSIRITSKLIAVDNTLKKTNY